MASLSFFGDLLAGFVGVKSLRHHRPGYDSAEVEAVQTMVEQGLQSRPYPLYFWEAFPAEHARARSESGREGEIAVEVKRFTRKPRDGCLIRAYQISEPRASVESVVEKKGELEVVKHPLETQFIQVEPQRGGLSGQDQETLVQVQAWVNQLNQAAREQHLQARRRKRRWSKSPLPPPAPLTPLQQSLQEIRQLQRVLRG